MFSRVFLHVLRYHDRQLGIRDLLNVRGSACPRPLSCDLGLVAKYSESCASFLQHEIRLMTTNHVRILELR